jgi:hypothetical protein
MESVNDLQVVVRINRTCVITMINLMLTEVYIYIKNTCRMYNGIAYIVNKLNNVDFNGPFYLFAKETGMEAYRGRGSKDSQILRLIIDGKHPEYTLASKMDRNRTVTDDIIKDTLYLARNRTPGVQSLAQHCNYDCGLDPTTANV